MAWSAVYSMPLWHSLAAPRQAVTHSRQRREAARLGDFDAEAEDTVDPRRFMVRLFGSSLYLEPEGSANGGKGPAILAQDP